MKRKFVYLIVFACFLASCRSSAFSTQEQRNIENKLQQAFLSQGYRGKVSIAKFGWDYASGDYFIYEYSEKINGKKETFTSYVAFDEKDNESQDPFSKLIFKDQLETGIDATIKREAMWRQGYVDKKLKEMSRFFSQHQGDFVFKDLSGSFSWREGDKDAQQLLLSNVMRNQEEQSPINGYYAIDVPTYLSNHALEIRVDFIFESPKDYYDMEDEEKSRIRQQFFDMVSHYDYREFWDGYYTVGFDWHSKDGWRGSIEDIILLEIRQGKVVKEP